MRIAYGYLTPAEALSNGQGNDRNMAWEMLHFIVMRPVLILFVMSGLGFIFILHKKDAPEATDSKIQASQLPKVGKHNWMKDSLDTSRSVAKTVKKQHQGNEGP
jgi:hypothetical protein